MIGDEALRRETHGVVGFSQQREVALSPGYA